mgnify:CR=1 FL=1
MKHLGIFILGALLLASCATNKRAAYIQQVQTDIPTAIEQDYQIRIKPLDRLTVTINSKDPELAAPFNAASSYNSLNGLSSYSSSSNGNLQILTVDKEGKIQLPIIGEIDCDGLTRNELAKKIDSAVFPGTQGGPLEHVIAAKAVCFGEALKPEFKDYARRIVENAQAMAAQLQARGVKLVSGGTDNHLMLVDLREEECTGKELETRLDSVHITANKNTVPGETRSPFVTSGVRLGTPAVTTRGMGEAEMKVIADCIADCIWHYDEKKDEISERVLKLTRDFPLYE